MRNEWSPDSAMTSTSKKHAEDDKLTKRRKVNEKSSNSGANQVPQSLTQPENQKARKNEVLKDNLLVNLASEKSSIGVQQSLNWNLVKCLCEFSKQF